MAKRGRPPLSGEFLNEIIKEYADEVNAAIAKGHRPRPAQAIAERRGANPETVKSWIFTARSQGLLPPTINGRARTACGSPYDNRIQDVAKILRVRPQRLADALESLRFELKRRRGSRD